MRSKNGLTSRVGGLVLVAVITFLVLYHPLAASQHQQTTVVVPTEEMRGVVVAQTQKHLTRRRVTCASEVNSEINHGRD